MEKRKRKADSLLMGGILLAGCLAALCFLFFSRQGDFVQVRVAGKVKAVYPLSADGSYKIDGVSGDNLLVIQGGEAWMEDASCPDRLCVKMGHISKNGQSVICLPNQVTVQIVAKEAPASEVDEVAG